MQQYVKCEENGDEDGSRILEMVGNQAPINLINHRTLELVYSIVNKVPGSKRVKKEAGRFQMSSSLPRMSCREPKSMMR